VARRFSALVYVKRDWRCRASAIEDMAKCGWADFSEAAPPDYCEYHNNGGQWELEPLSRGREEHVERAVQVVRVVYGIQRGRDRIWENHRGQRSTCLEVEDMIQYGTWKKDMKNSGRDHSLVEITL
jgi:hypothetical protein